MSTFWEMTGESRRALLLPDPETPFSSRARNLARLWAESGEDEMLMRLRHHEEIDRIESELDMMIHKVRVTPRRVSWDGGWKVEYLELRGQDDG
jgi:hypothetical protein